MEGEVTGAGSFDDFAIEMGDFELAKKKDFNSSFWLNTEGGSIDNRPMVHEGTVYFGSMNRNVYALDAATGREKWKQTVNDRVGFSSPQLYGNSLIIGSYDRNVYMMDLATGNIVWKFRTEGELASSGVISEGIYYFTGRDQFLYAIRCGDGRLLWKHRTFAPNVSVPTVHGDSVFFGSSDRNLYCLDRRSGSLRWKFAAEEEIVNVAPFKAMEGKIFFGTQGNVLRAVDMATGKEAWRLDTGEYGMSRGQEAVGRTLVQPTNGGNVYAFTPDGKVLWKLSGNHPFGAFATDGRLLYAGREDHHFYCIDPRDGAVVWKLRTEGPIWQPATIDNSTGTSIAYFGSYDCNLYAVKAEGRSCSLLWKFRCPGPVSAYPPIKSFFELTIKLPKDDSAGINDARRYSLLHLGTGEGDDPSATYTSRITYQTAGMYASKRGKYHVNSDEEGF